MANDGHGPKTLWQPLPLINECYCYCCRTWTRLGMHSCKHCWSECVEERERVQHWPRLVARASLLHLTAKFVRRELFPPWLQSELVAVCRLLPPHRLRRLLSEKVLVSRVPLLLLVPGPARPTRPGLALMIHLEYAVHRRRHMQQIAAHQGNFTSK